MKPAFLVTILFSVITMASDGAEQQGVPRVVLYQAINVSILAVILYFVLKDKVRAYYTNKRENYLRASREVAELKRQVEEQANVLRQKIKQLDQTADQSQKKAEADAREFNHKLLTEAREQAEKLKKEAEKTITAEVYRAVEGLKSELVDQAIGNSREIIQNQIKESDQKRLQSEFVEKIRVVEK